MVLLKPLDFLELPLVKFSNAVSSSGRLNTKEGQKEVLCM